MMKALTTALGALTILAVTGMATPSGQAMLGLRQTQTQTPVSVIADPGPANAAPVPVQVAPAAAVPAVSHAAAVPAAATTPAARPAVPHAAPVARPAAPASAAPVPVASPANAGAIANILLNLPQVLQPAQGRPNEPGPAYNNDQWVPPGHRKAKDRNVQWPYDNGDPGEQGH